MAVGLNHVERLILCTCEAGVVASRWLHGRRVHKLSVIHKIYVSFISFRYPCHFEFLHLDVRAYGIASSDHHLPCLGVDDVLLIVLRHGGARNKLLAKLLVALVHAGYHHGVRCYVARAVVQVTVNAKAQRLNQCFFVVVDLGLDLRDALLIYARLLPRPAAGLVLLVPWVWTTFGCILVHRGWQRRGFYPLSIFRYVEVVRNGLLVDDTLGYVSQLHAHAVEVGIWDPSKCVDQQVGVFYLVQILLCLLRYIVLIGVVALLPPALLVYDFRVGHEVVLKFI